MSRRLLNFLMVWFALFFAYIMVTTTWYVLGWKIFPLAYLFFVGELVWSNWAADEGVYRQFFTTIARYFAHPIKLAMVSVEIGLLTVSGIVSTIRAGRNGNLRPETTAADQK